MVLDPWCGSPPPKSENGLVWWEIPVCGRSRARERRNKQDSVDVAPYRRVEANSHATTERQTMVKL